MGKRRLQLRTPGVGRGRRCAGTHMGGPVPPTVRGWQTGRPRLLMGMARFGACGHELPAHETIYKTIAPGNRTVVAVCVSARPHPKRPRFHPLHQKLGACHRS